VRAIRIAFVELQAGLDELRALDQAGAGQISIGSLPLARAVLLPRALAAFAMSHPPARIRVVEGSYGELLTALREGELDFMLGALRDPANLHDLVQQALYTDELHIVARADHPLCGPDMPDRALLARYPWIIGAMASPMRRTWEQMFPDEPSRPAVQLECGSILVARGMLLDGSWLALMSPDQFRIERAAGLLAPVGPAIPGSRREIGLTTRQDWRATPTQSELIALITALAADYSVK
jgi:LysR family transcriptional regulator, regulator for genes of the gallate degradation pathway